MARDEVARLPYGPGDRPWNTVALVVSGATRISHVSNSQIAWAPISARDRDRDFRERDSRATSRGRKTSRSENRPLFCGLEGMRLRGQSRWPVPRNAPVPRRPLDAAALD